MKVDKKAINGGILLATFGLVSFLAIIHFVFDGLEVPFQKDLIPFFLMACMINYSVSILVSQFCLKAIQFGNNPKLMGLAYTLLSLLVISILYNMPYIIYRAFLDDTVQIKDLLSFLLISALYFFVLGFIPAIAIGIPYGLYLHDDYL